MGCRDAVHSWETLLTEVIERGLGVIGVLETVKWGGVHHLDFICHNILTTVGFFQLCKSGSGPAENNLSAVRFTPYMVFKARSNGEGAKNSGQIARHQSHKAPAQPFNGRAFWAL